MQIKESGENYLETILTLEKKNNVVRAIDIAKSLGYSKPSVTRAMSILKKNGYIYQESYGNIFLTKLGRLKANEIYNKHKLITKFLIITLGLDLDTADKDACRIEHIISEEAINKMELYVNKNDIKIEEK